MTVSFVFVVLIETVVEDMEETDQEGGAEVGVDHMRMDDRRS